jgi:hypothetical protein
MVSSRLLFCSIVIFFTFVLVLISAIRISNPQMLTYNISSQSTVNPQNSEFTSYPFDKNTYYLLPYPGILPNHPIYWLKMIRDQFHLFLTNSSQKKVDLLLKFADKRLSAGTLLIENNQISLGVTTITKAEKYLLKAGHILKQELKKEGALPTYEKVAITFTKHKYHIQQLKKYLNDSQKGILSDVVSTNQVFFENQLGDHLSQYQSTTSGQFK